MSKLHRELLIVALVAILGGAAQSLGLDALQPSKSEGALYVLGIWIVVFGIMLWRLDPILKEATKPDDHD